MYQVSIFDCCDSLLPDIKDAEVTDLQLDKIYNCLFDLKKFRKRIENHDLEAVMSRMTFYTHNGVIGMGIGSGLNNSTQVQIDKRGVEFDNDGIYHPFQDIALLLIQK